MFLWCGIGKRQRSVFCQTHLWAKTKCVQATIKFQGCWREGGCKRQQSATNHVQWVGLQTQLFSRWVIPDLECSFRSLCLFLRLSVMQTNGERLGHFRVSGWLLDAFQNSSLQGIEMKTLQDWSGGLMSYDAPVGSLVPGLWKQPFKPQPLIFHLLFRVHKSSEI